MRMTVETTWYNYKKTILKHKVSERLDGPTFSSAIQTTRRMTIRLEHTVDLIIDLKGCDLRAFSMFRGGHIAENLIPDNVRHFVIVLDKHGSLPRFVKTMVSIGRQLGSRLAANAVFVETVTEGIQFLESTKPR